MVKLFSNKELATCLEINPARWKRWSREFLPPDPLAGRQSGYARQYYLNDAFTVFFGGHLVGALRLAIPEARRVLSDLDDWLRKNGYRFDPGGGRSGPLAGDAAAAEHSITAYPSPAGGFHYQIRQILHKEASTENGATMCRVTYHESWLQSDDGVVPDMTAPIVIAISLILDKFLSAVDPQGHQFPRLHRHVVKCVS